jgi:hypothetical protein
MAGTPQPPPPAPEERKTFARLSLFWTLAIGVLAVVLLGILIAVIYTADIDEDEVAGTIGEAPGVEGTPTPAPPPPSNRSIEPGTSADRSVLVVEFPGNLRAVIGTG